MKFFKAVVNKLYMEIFVVFVAAAVLSYLKVLMAEFIIYIIDGIVMSTTDLPKYLTMFFYDDSVQSKILVATIFMIVIALVTCVFNYIKSNFNNKIMLGMNKNIKTLLLKHTTYLEYGEYTKYDNSQILQRVSGDSGRYISYLNSSYNLLLNTFFYTFFSLNVIVELNFKVTIILSVIILIIAILSIWYFKITKKIVDNQITLSESLIKKTMNSIYNPKMIKMTNNQEYEKDRFNKNSDECLSYDLQEIDYVIYYEMIASSLKSLSTPLIYLVCGISIINGNMQVGALMTIITFSSSILSYVQNVVYSVEGINGFLIPAKRLNDFMNLAEEDFVCKDLITNDYKNLEFKNVLIKFKDNIVLENVNFQINNGEDIYLVGPNGSGKSMLTKLLMGFITYDGSIQIDGIELSDLNKIKLRENIGLCFQTPYIFSDTIKNNIDCFENKTMDEVSEVAEICEISGEIEVLPNKYEEMLGERGINLSGGQKQRINIARLLIQNKKILIFDDVLSKLDNNTKNKIVENLKEKYPDNINIFITHDLLRIPYGSRVLFIDNKTIIDSTDEKLKTENDNYKSLIDICENIVGGMNE